MNASDELRRARFHECENYWRWKDARDRLDAVRKIHRRVETRIGPWAWCASCGTRWPCQTAEVIGEGG